MSGWLDTLFGNLPPQPARPTSRGALLGMGGYQQMPDAKASITDVRNAPESDYAAALRQAAVAGGSDVSNYAPPPAPGAGRPGWSDPMLDAGPTLSQGASDPDTYDYKTSFKPNWRPSPYNRPAPYNSFGGMGPNLPRGPQGTSVDPEMPYLGAHLPISPGDPGWTPPPSPSGPHNRAGDPSRPGYDSPEAPMDFSSAPGVNASQPSYQQLINFLQSWPGGTS